MSMTRPQKNSIAMRATTTALLLIAAVKGLKLTPVHQTTHRVDVASEIQALSAAFSDAYALINSNSGHESSEGFLLYYTNMLENRAVKRLRASIERWNNLEDKLRMSSHYSSKQHSRVVDDAMNSAAANNALLGKIYFKLQEDTIALQTLQSSCPVLMDFEVAIKSIYVDGWVDCLSSLGDLHIRMGRLDLAEAMQADVLAKMPWLLRLIQNALPNNAVGLPLFAFLSSLDSRSRLLIATMTKRAWLSADEMRETLNPLVSEFVSAETKRRQLAIFVTAQEVADQLITKHRLIRPQFENQSIISSKSVTSSADDESDALRVEEPVVRSHDIDGFNRDELGTVAVDEVDMVKPSVVPIDTLFLFDVFHSEIQREISHYLALMDSVMEKGDNYITDYRQRATAAAAAMEAASMAAAATSDPTAAYLHHSQSMGDNGSSSSSSTSTNDYADVGAVSRTFNPGTVVDDTHASSSPQYGDILPGDDSGWAAMILSANEVLEFTAAPAGFQSQDDVMRAFEYFQSINEERILTESSAAYPPSSSQPSFSSHSSSSSSSSSSKRTASSHSTQSESRSSRSSSTRARSERKSKTSTGQSSTSSSSSSSSSSKSGAGRAKEKTATGGQKSRSNDKTGSAKENENSFSFSYKSLIAFVMCVGSYYSWKKGSEGADKDDELPNDPFADLSLPARSRLSHSHKPSGMIRRNKVVNAATATQQASHDRSRSSSASTSASSAEASHPQESHSRSSAGVAGLFERVRGVVAAIVQGALILAAAGFEWVCQAHTIFVTWVDKCKAPTAVVSASYGNASAAGGLSDSIDDLDLSLFDSPAGSSVSRGSLKSHATSSAKKVPAAKKLSTLIIPPAQDSPVLTPKANPVAAGKGETGPVATGRKTKASPKATSACQVVPSSSLGTAAAPIFALSPPKASPVVAAMEALTDLQPELTPQSDDAGAVTTHSEKIPEVSMEPASVDTTEIDLSSSSEDMHDFYVWEDEVDYNGREDECGWIEVETSKSSSAAAKAQRRQRDEQAWRCQESRQRQQAAARKSISPAAVGGAAATAVAIKSRGKGGPAGATKTSEPVALSAQAAPSGLHSSSYCAATSASTAANCGSSAVAKPASATATSTAAAATATTEKVTEAALATPVVSAAPAMLKSPLPLVRIDVNALLRQSETLSQPLAAENVTMSAGSTTPSSSFSSCSTPAAVVVAPKSRMVPSVVQSKETEGKEGRAIESDRQGGSHQQQQLMQPVPKRSAGGKIFFSASSPPIGIRGMSTSPTAASNSTGANVEGDESWQTAGKKRPVRMQKVPSLVPTALSPSRSRGRGLIASAEQLAPVIPIILKPKRSTTSIVSGSAPAVASAVPKLSVASSPPTVASSSKSSNVEAAPSPRYSLSSSGTSTDVEDPSDTSSENGSQASGSQASGTHFASHTTDNALKDSMGMDPSIPSVPLDGQPVLLTSLHTEASALAHAQMLQFQQQQALAAQYYHNSPYVLVSYDGYEYQVPYDPSMMLPPSPVAVPLEMMPMTMPPQASTLDAGFRSGSGLLSVTTPVDAITGSVPTVESGSTVLQANVPAGEGPQLMTGGYDSSVDAAAQMLVPGAMMSHPIMYVPQMPMMAYDSPEMAAAAIAMAQQMGYAYPYYQPMMMPSPEAEAVVQVDPSETVVSIRTQIEYYFSPANLCHDMYLRSKMDEEGFVLLEEIANFRRIRNFNASPLMMLEAVQSSTLLDVVELWAVRTARGNTADTAALSPKSILGTKIRCLDSPQRWASIPSSSPQPGDERTASPSLLSPNGSMDNQLHHSGLAQGPQGMHGSVKHGAATGVSGGSFNSGKGNRKSFARKR